MRKTSILPLLGMLTLGLASCEGTMSESSSAESSATPTIVDPEVISSQDSSTSSTSEEYVPWVPEIIDLDDPTTFDDVPVDETVYDYGNLSFTTVSGQFSESGGAYTGTEPRNMAVNSPGTSPFTHGTFSADFTIPNGGDNGLVFGLSSDYEDDYWEGYGISYYFFFINFEGLIYLGKTDGGKWIELKTSRKIDLSAGNMPINLKVLFYGNKIICFVNGQLELAVRDNAYLTGSGYGFRTGAANAVIDSIVVSSERII